MEEIEDDDTAGELLVSVEAFYEECVEDIKNRKKRKVTNYIPLETPSGDEIPCSFQVKDTWKFLDIDEVHPKMDELEDDKVAALAAAHCMNARGIIAHGKSTTFHYSVRRLQGEGDDKRTVRSIFDEMGGGTKILDSIESICEEMLKNGPVVSTSFVLDETFATKHGGSFSKDRIEKNHEIVLIGWKQTEDGEFWVAKSPLTGTIDDGLSSGGLVSIPVRQFGVDGVCWAPKTTFKNMNWQAGPYWDKNLSSDAKKEWYSWKSRSFYCGGEGLQKLAKCIGVGFSAAFKEKTRFVIRDKHDHSNSRACYSTNVKWNEDRNKWEVQVTFTD